MNYSLPPLLPLPTHGPLFGPDLRLALQERSATRHDVRVQASRSRFVSSAGALMMEVEGLALPVGDGAQAFLSERIGRGRARLDGSFASRLNEWADGLGELLVRLANGRVRTVLPGAARILDTLELLEELLSRLKALPVVPHLEHCSEEDGELHLTLVAPELAGEVNEGDYIYGGFYLAHSETTLADTEASVRIYRVACRNGALMDCSEGQRLVLPRILGADGFDPYAGWQEKLGRVLAQSFDGGCIDEEARRFRSMVAQILATPYELLLNLVAQGILSEEESERIQREFSAGRDDSMFSLINAVTYQAHGLRDQNSWGRAFALERLGGEIIRGDHQPPVLEPAYT